MAVTSAVAERTLQLRVMHERTQKLIGVGEKEEKGWEKKHQQGGRKEGDIIAVIELDLGRQIETKNTSNLSCRCLPYRVITKYCSSKKKLKHRTYQ